MNDRKSLPARTHKSTPKAENGHINNDTSGPKQHKKKQATINFLPGNVYQTEDSDDHAKKVSNLHPSHFLLCLPTTIAHVALKGLCTSNRQKTYQGVPIAFESNRLRPRPRSHSKSSLYGQEEDRFNRNYVEFEPYSTENPAGGKMRDFRYRMSRIFSFANACDPAKLDATAFEPGYKQGFAFRTAAKISHNQHLDDPDELLGDEILADSKFSISVFPETLDFSTMGGRQHEQPWVHRRRQSEGGAIILPSKFSPKNVEKFNTKLGAVENESNFVVESLETAPGRKTSMPSTKNFAGPRNKTIIYVKRFHNRPRHQSIDGTIPVTHKFNISSNGACGGMEEIGVKPLSVAGLDSNPDRQITAKRTITSVDPAALEDDDSDDDVFDIRKSPRGFYNVNLN